MKNILEFLTQHPVFTREELVKFLVSQGTTNLNTHRATIQYHTKQKHMVRIKQALFASIPLGTNAVNHSVPKSAAENQE
ncbi:MAG: hypothetical protein KAT71_04450 [Gammaproteobacteria bacterium]|nr:hypothetical protein [Gammaproteobacteria bacterium]